ncbi:hypothetical protein IE81DRAFT_348849 [Ceraceosorus guamensis]|uniref:Uncharacterized protein n=1 Tax=Ceraceosorus guamensis TaxID=1522189 RepID=A0A316VX85_9BASI|nr:hypothetical protein IE81DRAFT_348849 [Ceraceosorus guamensis]PWN40901.1 hypothetical protein IE81DRAFT_348849 [Ceraceosorus guamensis]
MSITFGDHTLTPHGPTLFNPSNYAQFFFEPDTMATSAISLPQKTLTALRKEVKGINTRISSFARSYAQGNLQRMENEISLTKSLLTTSTQERDAWKRKAEDWKSKNLERARDSSALEARVKTLEKTVRDSSALEVRVKTLEKAVRASSALEARVQSLEKAVRASSEARVQSLEKAVRASSALEARVQSLGSSLREQNTLSEDLEAEVQELPDAWKRKAEDWKSKCLVSESLHKGMQVQARGLRDNMDEACRAHAASSGEVQELRGQCHLSQSQVETIRADLNREQGLRSDADRKNAEISKEQETQARNFALLARELKSTRNKLKVVNAINFGFLGQLMGKIQNLKRILRFKSQMTSVVQERYNSKSKAESLMPSQGQASTIRNELSKERRSTTKKRKQLPAFKQQGEATITCTDLLFLHRAKGKVQHVQEEVQEPKRRCRRKRRMRWVFKRVTRASCLSD